jgi:hypothetical protein
MNERVEGLTVEEDLALGFDMILRGCGVDATIAKKGSVRLVDLIKEVIDERAAEKAEEAIGTHTDNFDHDLMYQ